MAQLGSYSGETGSGYFSKTNTQVHNLFTEISTFTLNVLKEVHFKSDVFVICDYGTADGGTSLPMITACVEYIKNFYGKKQAIHIFYADQAQNDFTWLWMRLNGLTDGPTSYMTDNDNVFVSTIGQSFYQQCVPKESVNLSFSATAYHYLSKPLVCFKHSSLHLIDTTEEEKAIYKQQAKQDWMLILQQRGKELTSGGHMVISCLGVNPDGHYNGKSMLYKSTNRILCEMLEDGIINETEYRAIQFPMYFRNEEEMKEPFEDQKSEVTQAGLHLVHLKWVYSEDSLVTEWNNNANKNQKNLQVHAKAVTDSFKSWSFNIILKGIQSDTSEIERIGKANIFYKRIEKLAAEQPESFRNEFVSAFLHIKKK